MKKANCPVCKEIRECAVIHDMSAYCSPYFCLTCGVFFMPKADDDKYNRGTEHFVGEGK